MTRSCFTERYKPGYTQLFSLNLRLHLELGLLDRGGRLLGDLLVDTLAHIECLAHTLATVLNRFER